MRGADIQVARDELGDRVAHALIVGNDYRPVARSWGIARRFREAWATPSGRWRKPIGPRLTPWTWRP